MNKKLFRFGGKMNAEDLQGLLHMRKRAFAQKNGKAYNRKQKHKGKEQGE